MKPTCIMKTRTPISNLPIYHKDAGYIRGLGVYVKSNLPIGRETYSWGWKRAICVFVLLFTFYYLHIFLLSFTIFVILLCGWGCVIQYSQGAYSPTIVVCGDFNAHNTEWLHHSHTTDVAGLFCQEFAMAQYLIQIVDFLTRIPDRDGHQSYLLVLFLCCNLDLCTVAERSQK